MPHPSFWGEQWACAQVVRTRCVCLCVCGGAWMKFPFQGVNGVLFSVPFTVKLEQSWENGAGVYTQEAGLFIQPRHTGKMRISQNGSESPRGRARTRTWVAPWTRRRVGRCTACPGMTLRELWAPFPSLQERMSRGARPATRVPH